jgi:2-haloacid dehalogenase
VKLTDFAALTFDCYGTLIDWESGIAAALESWAEGAGLVAGREDLVGAFGRHESRIQRANPRMRYPELLGEVLRAAAADLGVAASDEDARAFGASVGDWPPFPDTVDALRYLKRHYRLVILSNVDRASFARSNERLGVEFDAIVTAEDVGSYKPDPRNFKALIERMGELGVPRGGILHTAQSLFHDIRPAKEAGLATAWIVRSGAAGGGTTPPVEAEPDFSFPTLGAMAAAHRKEQGGGGRG